MGSVNSVHLIGRLARDPELRTTPTGKNVASFRLAVRKQCRILDSTEPDARFFQVSCWGASADFVSRYLSKGRLVGITVRLDQRSYTDKDGNKRETIEVVAEVVNCLDRPPEEEMKMTLGEAGAS